jgi:CheY-like chemotaxis protein
MSTNVLVPESVPAQCKFPRRGNRERRFRIRCRNSLVMQESPWSFTRTETETSPQSANSGTHIKFFWSARKQRDNVHGSAIVVLTMAEAVSEHALVLIVEDEFLIRMATADAIRDAGFRVLEAGNADEAIAALERRDDIRVVFTDIRMPGSMDGAKLAHTIKQRWPPVRIMATSGQVALEKLELPAGTLLFPKPYTAEDVAWSLQALTGS